MKFGNNLKKLRKLKKLSQEDLAEKMNVSRQSVSKWENGEAYPEMNNILELCRVFHCQINELVNDSIIDIDSLDEEVKMNVVKLKKEQQSKMKGLSKAIAILARIGKVLCLISIPFIIISMIVLGVCINHIEIDENEIIWNNSEIIKIEDTGQKLSITCDEKTIIETVNQNEIAIIKNVLQNNSKTAIFYYTETGFAFLIGSIVLAYILLKSLEKLFNNFYNGDTPFTLENVKYIKKMAYLMIILTVVPNIMGLLFEVILKTDLNIEFEMFSLIEILFLFSIACIFEYGYEIQLDSKGKMYGDNNE